MLRVYPYLIMLLCLCSTGCSGQNTYDWNPGISAPKHYPAAYLSARFSFPDGGSTGASNSDVIDPGWGYPRGSYVTSGPHPVPSHLKVSWFSVCENKFYEGDFELPAEKMKQLFEEEWVDEMFKTKERFNKIIVGAAPGGVVAVWMNGLGRQVEVARFQAQENTSMTLEDYYEGLTNPQEMLDYLLGEENKKFIEEYGIPYEAWKNPEEAFDWEPRIAYPEHYPAADVTSSYNTSDGTGTGYSSGQRIDQNWGEPFKGEPVEGEIVEPDFKPVPIRLYQHWYSYADKKFYEADVRLPKDTIAKLLKEGYTDPEYPTEKQKYKRLITGMAPGGLLVVWLSGNTKIVELARYQAKELDIELNEEYVKKTHQGYYENMQEYLDEYVTQADRNYIATHGIPYDVWHKPLARYPWQQVLAHPAGYPFLKAKVRLIYPDMGYKQANENTPISSNWTAAPVAKKNITSSQPAPRWLQVRWYSPLEDKVYEGRFELPHQRVESLLQKGYQQFRTGLAPGGTVKLWIDSDKESLLLASFIAKESSTGLAEELTLEKSPLSKEEYISQYYPADELATDRKKTVPYHEWRQKQSTTY